MSRIGYKPIQVPAGVKIDIEGQLVRVEGPKGKMEQVIDSAVSVDLDGNVLSVNRANDNKKSRAFHGLYRSLLSNMVVGVSTGFKKTLVINGVGYRAEVQGEYVAFNLGYSSQILYLIPEGVSITCDGQTKVIVEGIDKQIVGQVSAEIRGLRAPEPYKGKGIRYEDEHIRRKVGKSGVK